MCVQLKQKTKKTQQQQKPEKCISKEGWMFGSTAVRRELVSSRWWCGHCLTWEYAYLCSLMGLIFSPSQNITHSLDALFISHNKPLRFDLSLSSPRTLYWIWCEFSMPFTLFLQISFLSALLSYPVHLKHTDRLIILSVCAFVNVAVSLLLLLLSLSLSLFPFH